MFREIWKGWTIGLSVILVPMYLLIGLFSPNAPTTIFIIVPLVPFIAAVLGLGVGAVVSLGLKIAEKRTKAV